MDFLQTIIYISLMFALLFGLIYFRKRKEKRLAEGWQIVPSHHPAIKHLEDISSLLIGASLGAYCAEYFQLSGGVFLMAAIVMLTIAPREKWLRPEESNPLPVPQPDAIS